LNLQKCRYVWFDEVGKKPMKFLLEISLISMEKA
jgi:hypothetical protein